MKKLANLFLMLAMLGLPIACGGGADMEVPPVTEVPQNPPSNTPSDPPQVGPSDFPEVQAVETPEICAIDDEDCGDSGPQVGPVEDPEYTTKPNYQLAPAIQDQINPCLLDPEAEGCE